MALGLIGGGRDALTPHDIARAAGWVAAKGTMAIKGMIAPTRIDSEHNHFTTDRDSIAKS
jgi:hypothetical protein